MAMMDENERKMVAMDRLAHALADDSMAAGDGDDEGGHFTRADLLSALRHARGTPEGAEDWEAMAMLEEWLDGHRPRPYVSDTGVKRLFKQDDVLEIGEGWLVFATTATRDDLVGYLEHIELLVAGDGDSDCEDDGDGDE
jgi:hypothetical protein